MQDHLLGRGGALSSIPRVDPSIDNFKQDLGAGHGRTPAIAALRRQRCLDFCEAEVNLVDTVRSTTAKAR